MKKLSDLLKHCNFSEVKGNADIDIEGVTYDSRRCGRNFAFFAFEGIHTDGNRYIDAAVDKGASAVFTSVLPEKLRENVTYVKTGNPKKTMSALSSALYDHPSSRLDVIGVTGTDGKSSSVFFLYQMLNLLGRKTGFLSTVEYSDGESIIKNPYRQSTPESSEIMMILDEMTKKGCTYAALESTSHGLSERTMRLNDVEYKAGIMTNISHEHLEFHGTIEKYADDKANLFRKSTLFNVVNKNDRFAPLFIEASKVPVYTYSISDSEADIHAEDIAARNSGTDFTAVLDGRRYGCRINIPGLFNVENFLGTALAVIKITGTDPAEVFALSGKLKSVKGRMEVVDCGQDFNLIVDYAHTPGAFTKLFPMMKRQTENRLIAVFGSAGERDTEKRAIQGKIASEYCDVIILADEDPRGEESMAVIDDIAAGIDSSFPKEMVYRIPDRVKAIEKAVETAEPGDTVLLLGKGHESSIIYKDGPITWDERAVAENAVRAYLKNL